MKTLSFAFGVVIICIPAAFAQPALPATSGLMKASFSNFPIHFIENRGVYPDEVKYYIAGADKTLFFTRDGITFRMKGKDRGWVVKLEFVEASGIQPEGQDRQEAVFSYFTGPEKDWKTGLPTFSKVVYRNLWPGIDLAYRGTVNRLKYEFVVAPGADPARIRLRYRGATSVRRTRAGALRVETPEGSFEDAPPAAWQDVDNVRVPVEMSYALGDGAEFGFGIGEYDRTRPLVLDPAVLVYCGYLGGASVDYANGIAVDGFGNAYVVGETFSPQTTFPVTVGPCLTYGNGYDVFVAKVNAAGTGLLYCGYIGGLQDESGRGIAVDRAGCAYVSGFTMSDQGLNSGRFPVKTGPYLIFNGNGDAFVAKVNPQGTALVYCGYIGGAGADASYGLAVDSAGNAYVAGHTSSPETSFPVRLGPDMTHNGGYDDAFVAKVNSKGTALVYCGYIGGARVDYGRAIAVDASGSAYVTGKTQSDEQTFPVTVGPDVTHNGSWDAFVAKVKPDGTALAYCGYIGGWANEENNSIAVDGAGNAYVNGATASTEQSFPVTVGPDLTYNGFGDAYVAKLNASGTALVYCGYVGGANWDRYGGIAVDKAGNAFISGETKSDEQTFPVQTGPDLTHNGGSWDVFVAKVNAPGTELVYCGYIGGAGSEGTQWRTGLAVDLAGSAYVTGYTTSSEQTFPVKGGPDLTYNGGTVDAFVAKVALTLLQASGTPRPGGKIDFQLTASDSGGLVYQVGSSLGTGPIQVGSRQLGLSPDDLLSVSVNGWWPAVFSGYRGTIDSLGHAKASINIPNIPALIGLRIHTAFVTLSHGAPLGIRSISNTCSFSIAK